MGQVSEIVLYSCILFLLIITRTSGANSDVYCLKSIKNSIEDPHNHLKSWNFNGEIRPGFICSFIGVACWNDLDNRVLNLNLSNLNLKGKFPLGIANCSSLVSLDLSFNGFYGEIPADICAILPFLVTVDLSENEFSGEIPAGFGNCSYLNVLELDRNRLSGQIPPEIGKLSRIVVFSVRGNKLVGPVPEFTNANVMAESYAGNPGLCGGPLKPCRR